MIIYNLERFLKAHDIYFEKALEEIKKGEKQSHWMWFIFPQLRGLGKTRTSEHYGIINLDEADAFLDHPVLGNHLREITKALMLVKNKTAFEIFGTPDYLKLKSCMTLFKLAKPTETIFQEVIDKYFMSYEDDLTRIKLDI